VSWGFVKLGDIAPSKPLKNPVIIDENNTWQLNLDMIESQSGRIIKKQKGNISKAGTSTHWFDSTHVLYSKLRPYLNKVVLPDEQGLATTELVPMLPDAERLDRNYLMHYLRSKQFVNWIKDQVAGAKMPRVSMTVFWSHKIPLPYIDDPKKSLLEQKRIAAVLGKADAIRRKSQQAINLADDFLRSVFLDMFGDLATNPKGWDVKAIKEFATVTTGNTPSRKMPEYYGNDVEWIKSGNINTPQHTITMATEYLSNEGVKVARTVPKGSTLITCIAGSFDCIGNAAYTDREVSFNQQINALTPTNGVLSWFLYALVLFSKKTIQNASTNSMKGMISKGKLQEVKLILPPIELQRKFEDIFAKQINSIELMNQSHKHSNETFHSLSQKAFAGEL
jgi:type I restriction enzyme S subunit